MACGSCGGSRAKYGIKPPPIPAPQYRIVPNPMAMQRAKLMAAAAGPQTPFAAHMSRDRRIIEQKRRVAVLRALGK